MTGFNHGLTGAVIALSIKQPALAVPLAFASHFLQDIVPHWDYSVTRTLQTKQVKGFFTKRHVNFLISDFCLAAVLMITLGLMFPAQKWRIWLCMIAAASPDLMWAYYRLYIQKIKARQPKLDPLARLHASIQWSQTAKGALVEVLWFIGAWFIILAHR